jgi:hypothetical protein
LPRCALLFWGLVDVDGVQAFLPRRSAVGGVGVLGESGLVALCFGLGERQRGGRKGKKRG